MSQLVINILDKALKSKGQTLKKTNEYMWWSPFVTHHKPKLQVNIQTGKWHCWVSNQGGHNLYQLFKKVGAGYEDFKELNQLLGETSFYQKDTDKKLEVIQLPQEMKLLSDKKDTSIIKEHALRFLRKRGITSEDIKRYNLGYCSEGVYQNRIIIPSYDSIGKLNYFVGRDFYASTLKAEELIEEDGGISSVQFEFTEWSHLFTNNPIKEIEVSNKELENSLKLSPDLKGSWERMIFFL